MSDIITTCRDAWQGSKRETQPNYDDLDSGYREMLTARAEAVLATHVVSPDVFNGFEQLVLDSTRREGEQQAEKEETSDEPDEPEPAAKKPAKAAKKEPVKRAVKVIKKAAKKKGK
jgi:hypothetical protein